MSVDSIARGNLALRSADMNFTRRSGRQSATHAIENVGETDVHSLAGEIKRP